MRIPLLPRDKPQPPLSRLQACSVGGLVISLRPGTEAVVSHHYPGGRTRGYQISGGGRQVSLGRKSLRPAPRKIVNGLKGSPNQMQGSVGVNTCMYAPTQIILPSGKGSLFVEAPCTSFFMPGQWVYLFHRGAR